MLLNFKFILLDEEFTLDEKFRIKFSVEDKTRFDYWKRNIIYTITMEKIFNYCQKNYISRINFFN